MSSVLWQVKRYQVFDLNFKSLYGNEPGSCRENVEAGGSGGRWARVWVRLLLLPALWPGRSASPSVLGFLIVIFLTIAGKTEPKFKHPFGPLIWGSVLQVVSLSYRPVLGDSSQFWEQLGSRDAVVQEPWITKGAWLGRGCVSPTGH